jgi:hypothetical protein
MEAILWKDIFQYLKEENQKTATCKLWETSMLLGTLRATWPTCDKLQRQLNKERAPMQ